MFLKIPATTIQTVNGTFSMKEFAAYILDHSPAITSRNVMRLVSKAVDAIGDAKHGVAELPDDAAEAFRVSSDAAPPPQLLRPMIGASGQLIPDRGFPIGNSELLAFYEAVENMTAERPAVANAAPVELPVAAE